MYYSGNTTYLEGTGDYDYFIYDGNYSKRMKREAQPP